MIIRYEFGPTENYFGADIIVGVYDLNSLEKQTDIRWCLISKNLTLTHIRIGHSEKSLYELVQLLLSIGLPEELARYPVIDRTGKIFTIPGLLSFFHEKNPLVAKWKSIVSSLPVGTDIYASVSYHT